MTEKKQQQPFLAYIIIFIVGFICGVGFAAYKLGSGEKGNSVISGQQTENKTDDNSAAITNLEAAVTANPEDFQSWVHLGHLYFDTNQYDKAIAAYTTSLKYHSGNADLLTDLGVMHRRSDRPEVAIEWFKKAQAMDEIHQPSRFNEGIVRFYDLKDTEGAIASWEELLRINPDATAGNGKKIKDFVDEVKNGTLKP
jgi:cytochrome c-type biogenesis protein CcmH/NrfG